MQTSLREKIPPRYLSRGAMVVGLVVCGALLAAGRQNPRRFTVTMSVNHHLGYGMSRMDCRLCHVPVEGRTYGTQLGCMTGSCHGPLDPAMDFNEAVEIVKNENINQPDAETQAIRFVTEHRQWQGTACWECHTEHTNRPTLRPKGRGHASAGEGAGYRSIFLSSGDQKPDSTASAKNNEIVGF